MMRCCICRKEFEVLYPDLWRYRNKSRWYCSWKCLRADERKEAGDMAYSKIKKDGTPAKKPTGKKKEEPTVTLVYDPSIEEEYRREQEQKKSFAEMKKPVPEEKKIQGQEPLEVASLKSRVLKDAYYRKTRDGRSMFLEGDSLNDSALGLKAENWIRLTAEILLALEQLGIKEGDPEDYTGNNGPL